MTQAGFGAREVLALLSDADEKRRAAAFLRMRRLAMQAASAGIPEAGRTCHALRDDIWAACEAGEVQVADARALCREVDIALQSVLESNVSATRAMSALERAAGARTPDAFLQAVLEGAASADSAAIYEVHQGHIRLIAAHGLDARDQLIGDPTVTQAARDGLTTVAPGTVGGTVAALPLHFGNRITGVLRVASRSVFRFETADLHYLHALCGAGAATLAAYFPAREERLRALVEALPLPTISVDRRGLVRTWNRAAEEVLGWTRDEVVGRLPPQIPDEERATWQAMLQQRGVVRGYEVRRLRKDGTMIDCVVAQAPLPEGMVSVLTEVSEQTRRVAAAENAAHFREHFVGVVSHDLRNPLTAILSSAQLLLRYANLDPQMARAVTRIVHSAERMSRMINDLLDFTRSRLGGEFPVHPSRVDLREVCSSAVDELELAYPDRKIVLDAPHEVWGDWDPDRIAQVLVNLLGNAVQHGAAGEVRLSLREDQDEAVLETHNVGAPIPPDVLPHIFEPGRRGDAHPGGLGLGLFIVRQIIHAHGGSIAVTSSANDGTTFIARLPRRARHG